MRISGKNRPNSPPNGKHPTHPKPRNLRRPIEFADPSSMTSHCIKRHCPCPYEIRGIQTGAPGAAEPAEHGAPTLADSVRLSQNAARRLRRTQARRHRATDTHQGRVRIPAKTGSSGRNDLAQSRPRRPATPTTRFSSTSATRRGKRRPESGHSPTGLLPRLGDSGRS
jgi:hypothetical protein